MDEQRRRDVALFRYGLCRQAADPRLGKRERGALVRALVAQEHVGADGELVMVGRSTLDKWIAAWRRGGFDALVPRDPVVSPRTPAEVLELAAALRREVPARTAAQVRQVVLAASGSAPAVRTLQRHFERLGLNAIEPVEAVRVFGRFEAAAPNELWQGDGMHGPKIEGRRAVLRAFIDDYSRLLVGYRWGTGEDVIRLEAALRAALLARGVPDALLVDRGSAFVSAQLVRACAVLGVRLVHAAPRAASTKGKIERFFRSVRGRFLVELEARTTPVGLEELNRLFQAWVEQDYHRREHSETEATPLDRFATAGPVTPPTAEQLREAFLWCETRKAHKKTAVVELLGNRYEVDPQLAGRYCELLFDPFELDRIEVRYGGQPFGLAVAVEICRRVHPRAAKEPAPAHPATGIDYLALVAAERDARLAGPAARTSFAALADNDDNEKTEERR